MPTPDMPSLVSPAPSLPSDGGDGGGVEGASPSLKLRIYI